MASQPAYDVTNVLQVVRLSSENPTSAIPSSGRDRLVGKCGAGTVCFERMNPGWWSWKWTWLANRSSRDIGVRVAGNGTIVRRGAGFIRLGTKGPVVDNLRLEVIGRAEFPEPRQIVIGQTLRDGEDGQWAEVEGSDVVKEEPAGVKLELSAGADRMQVEIADGFHCFQCRF